MDGTVARSCAGLSKSDDRYVGLMGTTPSLAMLAAAHSRHQGHCDHSKPYDPHKSGEDFPHKAPDSLPSSPDVGFVYLTLPHGEGRRPRDHLWRHNVSLHTKFCHINRRKHTKTTLVVNWLPMITY